MTPSLNPAKVLADLEGWQEWAKEEPWISDIAPALVNAIALIQSLTAPVDDAEVAGVIERLEQRPLNDWPPQVNDATANKAAALLRRQQAELTRLRGGV